MFFKDFVSVKRQKIKRGASQTYDTPPFNCLLKRWLLAFFSVNGSRGSVIDKAEDLQKISEGFGVFGNYKEAESQEFGSNWFNNVKVTYSSQDIKWTYSPVKYWLPQGHIDFLAYAPRVEETTLKNKSCIDFTVEGEVAK